VQCHCVTVAVSTIPPGYVPVPVWTMSVGPTLYALTVFRYALTVFRLARVLTVFSLIPGRWGPTFYCAATAARGLVGGGVRWWWWGLVGWLAKGVQGMGENFNKGVVLS
jgi:hypothetical protein